jgi:hypothetical protein
MLQYKGFKVHKLQMLQLLNSRNLTSFHVISAVTAHEVPAITYEHRPRAYEFNQLLHGRICCCMTSLSCILICYSRGCSTVITWQSHHIFDWETLGSETLDEVTGIELRSGYVSESFGGNGHSSVSSPWFDLVTWAASLQITSSNQWHKLVSRPS